MNWETNSILYINAKQFCVMQNKWFSRNAGIVKIGEGCTLFWSLSRVTHHYRKACDSLQCCSWYYDTPDSVCICNCHIPSSSTHSTHMCRQSTNVAQTFILKYIIFLNILLYITIILLFKKVMCVDRLHYLWIPF